MYYIISKVELTEGVITHTPIGYTVEEPNLPCTAYSDWTKENAEQLTSGEIMAEVFFNTHPVCHVIGWYTTDTNAPDFQEIVDTSILT
jgi:hypothetical protein